MTSQTACDDLILIYRLSFIKLELILISPKSLWRVKYISTREALKTLSENQKVSETYLLSKLIFLKITTIPEIKAKI